jgi:hypothetical protein
LRVKTEIWPDDTSMPQMGDWLAELRGEGDAEPPAGRHARPPSDHSRGPDAVATTAADIPITPAETIAGAEVRSHREDMARAEATACAEATARADADARARVRITERAVIGDELRIPIMWCEMGSCIAWHADPAALGETDIRARAIAAGWRVDALGRLACPRCQQTNGGFRTTHPVRPHGRDRAITMPAARRERAAGAGGRADAGAIPPAAPALVPLPAQEQQPEPVSHSGHAR